MTFEVGAVTLDGDLVRLEPLSVGHHDGLVDAVQDGDLWRLWWTSVPRPEQVGEVIEQRLAALSEGLMVPFVTVRRSDGLILGMTSFYDIVPSVPRLSIGWTWNRRSAQRSGSNLESKLLLMTHAFEVLQVEAVRFETSWANQQSRAAIEGLGARLDGVLRAQRRERNGVLGDLVVYSVLAHEWPSVLASIRTRLQRHALT